MFCPQCGLKQSEELKYCKICGANLKAVRQVVATRETDEETDGKTDWSKTWGAVIQRHQEERKHSSKPEVKRYNEIKAGVITSLAGLGIMLFLYVFMNGIILSGEAQPSEAAIIGRIWVAGVIPFFIGLALLINGIFVSKKLVEIAQRGLQAQDSPKALTAITQSIEDHASSSADRFGSDSARPSVTEHTTRQLRNSD
jgi:hypothetical protein